MATELKPVLHEMLNLIERLAGVRVTADPQPPDVAAHAQQVRDGIAALEGPEGAPLPSNPWTGKPDSEVIEAAIAGDQQAAAEYRERTAAAAKDSPATTAPAAGEPSTS